MTLIAAACAGIAAPAKHEITPNLWIKVGEAPPAPPGILAYSGGALDPVSRQFLVFGGGHGDYWGNEVYALDLDAYTWRQMYAPDEKSRYTLENIDVINGKLYDSDKPFTRHTYNTLTYVPPLRGMFVWSGAGPGWRPIAPSKIPPDAWIYRYKENRWEMLSNTAPRNMGGATCYDEKRKVIWAVQGTNTQTPVMHRFDPATRTWSSLSIQGIADHDRPIHNKLVCAKDFDKLLLIGGSKGMTWLIDPNTMEATRVAPGYQPASKDGLIYDSRRKVAYLVGEGRWAWFEFETRQWHDLPSASLPKLGSYGIWGRIAYDAEQDIVLIVVRSGTFITRPLLHNP